MSILLYVILIILILFDAYVLSEFRRHEAAIVELLKEHPQLLADDREEW